MSDTALLKFGCAEMEPLRRALLTVTPTQEGMAATILGSDHAAALEQYLPRDPRRRGAILGLADGYASGYFDKSTIGVYAYDLPDTAAAKDVAVKDMVPLLTHAIDRLATPSSANLLVILRAFVSKIKQHSDEWQAWRSWVRPGWQIGRFDGQILREKKRAEFAPLDSDLEESFPWPLILTEKGGGSPVQYITLDGKTVITTGGPLIWSYAGEDYAITIRTEHPIRTYVSNVTPAPSAARMRMIELHMGWMGFTSFGDR